jgi:hypothetical protein
MNLIPSFLTNPLIIAGIIAIAVSGVTVALFRYITRHERVMWQVSEVGNNGIFRELDSKATTSVFIRTKDRYRAVRRADGIPTKAGRYKQYTIFPTKLAVGYVWKLDTTKESYTFFEVINKVLGEEFINQLEVPELEKIHAFKGQFNNDTKIGSFFDALQMILEPETIKAIDPEYQKKLMDSKLYVTVDLEKGQTPEGYQPISDKEITYDANRTMANLLSQGVEGLQKRDWIFIGAVFLAGMGTMLLLEAIGLTAK